MANFLFWNVGGNPLFDQIPVVCRENEVDVLILAEYPDEEVQLILAMNAGNQRVYAAPFNPSDRLKYLTRFPPDALVPVLDEGGVSIRQVRAPLGPELLLVALHLPSKLHRTGIEQTIFSIDLGKLISSAEARCGHSNSLIMGDLNMDPYEDGVVSANGLHGVMDKAIALEGDRIVDGKARRYFYNPMWSYLGDESVGPPGTYFRRGGQVSRFWHTFDQVLLRPALLTYYSPPGVRVITSIGNRDLLRNGKIDRSISDHLPILLRLNIEQG